MVINEIDYEQWQLFFFLPKLLKQYTTHQQKTPTYEHIQYNKETHISLWMPLYLFIHTQNDQMFYHKSECLLHTCTGTSFMQIRCKLISIKNRSLLPPLYWYVVAREIRGNAHYISRASNQYTMINMAITFFSQSYCN